MGRKENSLETKVKKFYFRLKIFLKSNIRETLNFSPGVQHFFSSSFCLVHKKIVAGPIFFCGGGFEFFWKAMLILHQKG